MSYKLSPSRIHFISQCKLRFVLSTKNTNEKYGSPLFDRYSFLGILLHAVLEEFIKEDHDSVEFDNVWSRQLERHVKIYSISRDLRLNLEYQLPYYVIKREKLRLLINELIMHKSPYLEAEVRIVGDHVSGFADLVEEDMFAKKVNIIDLKTGPIWELARGEIKKLKEGYRKQLLTYGTAYWEKGYHAEDISCSIKGLSEDENISMTFTPEEYEIHQKFLKNIKQEIVEADLARESDKLASPAVESCKYCEHTLNCSSLHKLIQEDSMIEAPFAIIDEISSEFDDLNAKINITTNQGITSIHRIPNELFKEIRAKVKLGTSVFVQGLYVLSNTRIKYWTNYSSYNSL